MVMCSVADVRAYCSPRKLTDYDIADIITVVSTDVLTKAEATDESNKFLVQAVIHLSVATVMKRARSSGELAERVSTPEYSQQNTGLSDEIKSHETEAATYIQKYKDSVTYSNFSIPSGRMGFGTVNSELY